MSRKVQSRAIYCLPLLLAFVLLCVGCGKSNSGNAKAHSVKLSWTPSTSSVAGYNVYRQAAAGGPAVKLTSQPLTGHEFTNKTVEAGKTYSYYVTSVNSNGAESAPTNRTMATVPSP
ncbi:MAG TPA: fibronectin type III domain-containing protein [Candidatus Dormibacteraeota bacterium]|nr:fibronectin type III domain-containing protein [Candidatus Dormibacteraeota bacterium]